MRAGAPRPVRAYEQGNLLQKDQRCTKIIAHSLLHFDGQRYELTDFVVMPNHVHLLVAFPDDDQLLKQSESWKLFTATEINKLVGSTGRFCQQDGFDHLVRSEKQFEYLREPRQGEIEDRRVPPLFEG